MAHLSAAFPSAAYVSLPLAVRGPRVSASLPTPVRVRALSLTNRPHLSDPSSPPRSRPATASAIPAGDPLAAPHAVIPGLPFYLVPRDPALFPHPQPPPKNLAHPPRFCPAQRLSSAPPWNRHHAANPPRQVPTLAPHRRPEGHQPLVRDSKARLLGNSTGPISSERRRPMNSTLLACFRPLDLLGPSAGPPHRLPPELDAQGSVHAAAPRTSPPCRTGAAVPPRTPRSIASLTLWTTAEASHVGEKSRRAPVSLYPPSVDA